MAGQAKRLVPLDQFEIGLRDEGQYDVSEQAVHGHRAGSGHVNETVGRRARGAPDVGEYFGGDQHAESAITEGHAIADRLRRVTADPWIDVTAAFDLQARLDDIADVNDPGVLARLDEVYPHITDAAIFEHQFRQPRSIHGEAALRPAGCGPESQACNRKS